MVSQESEQAQEAWIAHFNNRYNEHTLPYTGSAVVGMVDLKAALKAEIEKEISEMTKEREMDYVNGLKFVLSLLDTVTPIKP